MIDSIKKIPKLFTYIIQHWALLKKLRVIKNRQILYIFILGTLTVFFEILGLSMLIPILVFLENGNDMEQFARSSILTEYVILVFSYFGLSVSLLNLSIIAIIATFLRQLNNYFNNVYVEKVKWMVDQRLQYKFFNIIMKSAASYIHNFRIGFLSNITAIEVPQTAAIIRCYGSLWMVIITSFAYISFLFISAPKITLGLIVVSSVIIITSTGFIAKSKKISQQNLKYRNYYRDFILEKFSAWKLIRLNNNLNNELDNLATIQNNIVNNEIKLARISGMLSLIFIPAATLVLLIALNISVSILEIKLTLLMTFGLAFLRILPITISFQSNINKLVKYFPSAKHLEDVVNKATLHSEDIYKGKQNFTLEKGISFHSVYYSYANRKKVIIKNLSFFIKAGTLFGISGESGAGKSTIVDMLPRIIDPTRGSIKIDNINVKNISLKALRDSIAYLPQEPILFNMSLKNNLIYSKKNITDSKIWEALKMANAYKFVKSLPQKLDTNIGQMGKNLSGGQRQRIVLARAFLQKPRVLILDEPTSALDANTESYIQKILKDFQIKFNSTIILISHKSSTIVKCDDVLYIKEGKLDEKKK